MDTQQNMNEIHKTAALGFIQGALFGIKMGLKGLPYALAGGILLTITHKSLEDAKGFVEEDQK